MHPQLKIAYAPIYAHPLPEGHRFPMSKYELIPAQLLYEGTLEEQNIFSSQPCIDEIILWTHEAVYLDKLKSQTLSEKEQRHIGFPQSPQLTERELIITQGTIDCCDVALLQGVALNVAGGTHHAYADRGEGFCMLNDMAVAANYLLRKNISDKILIIDLDVHQGNGTAKIFENDPGFLPSVCMVRTIIHFIKKKAISIFPCRTALMMQLIYRFCRIPFRG